MKMNYDYEYKPGCKNYNEYIAEYINLVEQNKIKTCEEQKLLVKMIKHIFSIEDLIINPSQIEKYFSYQKYFDFNLLTWEKFCFVLHNCVFKVNGLPRFPDLFILGGRGIGKNGYLAFEDFCLITPTNGIREYDIDICANSEEQAKTSFVEIYNVLENPKNKRKLMKFFKWTQTKITNRQTNSTIRFRTNNPKGKDGLKSGKVDFDEPHMYENWKNIDVFTTGLGKKAHPRKSYTSTNGEVRDGPLDNLIEKSEMILRGEIKDNGFLPFICKLDDEKEVEDPTNWAKANPSLPFFPSLMEEMLKEYDDYKLNPIANSSFMTKRMNIPKTSNELAVASIDDIKETNREIPDLKGKKCVAGIDLMKKNDFLSASLLFKDKSVYYVISHTWVCKKSADLHRIRPPLHKWEEMGLLTFVDDVEIDPKVATDWLLEQNNKYKIQKIAVDDYRFALVREALEKAFPSDYIKMVRPSDIMRIAPIIDSAFVTHKIIWGDNPLLRWATNNTKKVPTVNGNYKFDKIEPKARKNDPFMSVVHAFTLSEEIQLENVDLVFMDAITI